jgi:hypothetical protein
MQKSYTLVVYELKEDVSARAIDNGFVQLVLM